MQLTKEQVAEALLSHYKRNGMDMSALLRDPVFTGLPAEVKVSFVHNHAKELAERINPNTSSYERGDLALSAAKGAFTTTVPTALAILTKHYGGDMGAMLRNPATSVALKHILPFTLVGGAAAGALVSYLENVRERNARQQLKSQAVKAYLTQDPVDSVGVLSSGHIHDLNSRLGEKIRSHLREKFTHAEENFSNSAMSDYDRLYKGLNENP